MTPSAIYTIYEVKTITYFEKRRIFATSLLLPSLQRENL